MDLVLELCDEHFLDALYQSIPMTASWPRDSMVRQTVSLIAITYTFALFNYFVISTFSYVFLFDKSQEKHPKFLKNQIKVATDAMLPITLLTMPWFLAEVRGYSMIYKNVDDFGWAYLVASGTFFLFFTDMMIYWIHRYLHHPLLYARLHKPHHRWIIPTPYASYAFHPLDGYLQSVPYHVFAFLFPIHRGLYLAMFLFVNVWTISIHDGEYMTHSPLINGAANHTIHHLYFNYNYGQYFTLWDRIGGTFRAPTGEQYDRKLKNSKDNRIKQSLAVENILSDDTMKDAKAHYLVENVKQTSKIA